MKPVSSLIASEVRRFERFLDKTKDDCWMWKGATTHGYGIFQTSTMVPKTQRATRFAFQIWNGPIPKGMQIQHSCDRPACCNPEHLWLGFPAQNSARMVRLGRSARGLRHGLAKLSDSQVTEIYRLCCEKLGEHPRPHAKGNEAAYKQIATQFGISYSHVRNIHRGRRRSLSHGREPAHPQRTPS